MSKEKRISSKKSSNSSGFFIATWFWVVGMTFFYLPNYFGAVPNILEVIFNSIGWITVIIGVGGILIEASYFLKNEAFNYWGISLVFLLVLLCLYYVQINYVSNIVIINVIKSICIILFLIGTGMFLYGISFFFNKPIETDFEVSNEKQTKKSKVEMIITISIAMISIITAIIQLTTAIIKINME
ncbi:hypothetical protein PO903_16720 [Paenibacillus sp. PK4536]|uniref:hypothetical protein n=1 Tax=Paenibacillus sp. PK4536 TaxID=3024576 RepID=UPI00235A3D36|nr:hypothetical protein [Paenibacillus sp. PK4536]WIM38282.1 hypothetical protein PO903_16720 [Paenibacillus sp. PK4536]